MKAAYIKQTGPPENIIVGELPTPEPTGSQVLVRVKAAALNPIDTYIRSRHGPDGHPAAVRRRLRSGRRRRESSAPTPNDSKSAIASGDRIRVCSADKARSPSTPPSTNAWLYPIPAGVSDETPPRARSSASPPSRSGARRQAASRRNAVRQRRHRRRRLDGRANGQGDRRQRDHHRRQRRESESSAANWAPTSPSTTRTDDVVARVEGAAPNGINVWWETHARAEFRTRHSAARPARPHDSDGRPRRPPAFPRRPVLREGLSPITASPCSTPPPRSSSPPPTTSTAGSPPEKSNRASTA